MSKIKLDADQTARVVELIQNYFRENLDKDIGRFEAEFLLDFFAEQIGPVYYNQAIADANTLLMSQLDSMSESLSELEKWTPAQR